VTLRDTCPMSRVSANRIGVRESGVRVHNHAVDGLGLYGRKGSTTSAAVLGSSASGVEERYLAIFLMYASSLSFS
jgi:hypothetical protein